MSKKHDELMRVIGNLEGTINTGFKSINKHLEGLNGSVKEHSKYINQEKGASKERDKTSARLGGWAGLKVSMIVSIVGGVLLLIINHFVGKV